MSTLQLEFQSMLRLKRAITAVLITTALTFPARGQLYPSTSNDLSDQIDLQASEEEVLEIERNAELEQKRHQKRETQQERNKLIKKENSLLKQLQQIDIKLSITRKEITEYKQKIQDYTLKAEKLQLDLQALKIQYQQYKKRLAKKPDSFNPGIHMDMTDKLMSWYERVGNFAPDASTGAYVRKADYDRYLEWQAKQIPKKGLGGLIPNYKANLRRP